MNCTARGRLNITRHPLPHEALQCRYRKLSVLARFACYIVFDLCFYVGAFAVDY